MGGEISTSNGCAIFPDGNAAVGYQASPSGNSPIGPNAFNGKGNFVDGKSAVDDADWFAAATRTLLPNKAGTHLFLTTGCGDERLCQRYAAGHVKPPAYFLRRLQRSEYGWQWLCAVMDGASPQWWRELQQDRDLARSVRAAIRHESC